MYVKSEGHLTNLRQKAAIISTQSCFPDNGKHRPNFIGQEMSRIAVLGKFEIGSVVYNSIDEIHVVRDHFDSCIGQIYEHEREGGVSVFDC